MDEEQQATSRKDYLRFQRMPFEEWKQIGWYVERMRVSMMCMGIDMVNNGTTK
jgi:hypothetical protein